jgi:hypothetical protein
MRIRTELWKGYVCLEFDSGVLGEFENGFRSGIDVDFELNGVFVFLNDFYKNVASLKLDVEYGVNKKND